MSFASLGLSAPILKALDHKGYKTPSPIQAQAIPVVLEGRDLLAAAQTGTGKTAGFTLPLLELLSQTQKAGPKQVRALILTPTRELAAQIADNISAYSKYLPLKSTVVFGGVGIGPQITTLRRGIDILVATPGRLLDLHQQNAVSFHGLEILVLDEADRMLDMGFIHDIKRILKLLPAKRQNLLFSATFSPEIRTLAHGLLHNAAEVSVTPRNSAAESVKQWIVPVDKNQKPALLAELTRFYRWQQVLVFCRTKHGANRLVRQMEAEGIKAAAIHGNKSQNARTQALADFKRGAIRMLIATDIAARGIDISELPNVVNFELPHVPEDYVHRIGRTGRAGASGEAASLVCNEEAKQLRDIERLIKQSLPRKEFVGFEPVHGLPPSENQGKSKPGSQQGAKPGNKSQGRKPQGQSRNAQPKQRQGSRAQEERNLQDKAPSRSEQPRRERSSNDQARAEKPRTDKPRSDRARSDKARSDNARSESGRSDIRSDSARNDKPRTDRPNTDRAAGNKPRSGNRPQGQGQQRAQGQQRPRSNAKGGDRNQA
ncbi:DEAD/DEAH box helicase [Shewanella litorisediminis]|uniref:ATP-dependent RNA helicase RhlE n=1 Tax=Shewanella litorisediminis TaxID=1173586 RepID=A0ABX7G131_9GAMM|nr:DEAD/DEAH box helicase [Shewanella litorisediminis]MCL2918899.1 DEAD/DEAH box helicase [Shewanella litorisediminis]QRH00972.1 DEAD/DEAH box helicase [Shewanella litorisediminis]